MEKLSTLTDLTEPCWNCSGKAFIARGFDEFHEPITICTDCHERQEGE